MKKFPIQPARASDAGEISALNSAAFGGPAEATLVAQLASDGEALGALVAAGTDNVVGHLQMFSIRVDGAPIAAGIGPMSVRPDLQRTGIGSALMTEALAILHAMDIGLVFVLGHPAYYPKFGFSADLAKPFDAPYSGEAFMVLRLDDTAPTRGKLTYPAAFGAA